MMTWFVVLVFFNVSYQVIVNVASGQRGRRITNNLPYLQHQSEVVCHQNCVGQHDLGCYRVFLNTASYVCRCQPNYFVSSQICQQECQSEQYWNRFFYGECVTAPTLFHGSCSLTCIYRLRGWAIFVIVLVSLGAGSALLFGPAMFLISYRYLRLLRRHKRYLESRLIPFIFHNQNSESKKQLPADNGNIALGSQEPVVHVVQ
ncbi:hypothetical protein T4B_14844 [Trichinella pseudospiralis]|uniref:EGF-like domain-containing protein n=2 Tax=Trichinella pseudospiralis TaxID=6337 RepID=A0A0V1IV98_TRIPS|nr:hypothetical protein T4E_7860 [Trichinella pseudospiralis]KRY77359.1 hypothetical protein T4A_3150 [Trichinella pseudospiralis]KRY89799.1 hypothetical protein T4D_11828 [Trichinella pseudospiralis]KRZ26698.1 hypothetical protein T4B_14844 [Trichinella pseudospiralis]KRZ44581.1 hypothetical protein T4C_12309 [Trichinella pseudospiralis]